jgi:hypothetical protein
MLISQFSKDAQVTFKRQHQVITPTRYQIQLRSGFLFPPPFGIHCYLMLWISIIFRTLRDEETKFIP